ncbi:uncharacterized protein LOC112502498 isoform X4 [Cynara cardunculus var. scolymus]|uniref:uncharacterized protein LOC112502498 isoform X4 n=1 Tax=Cynara cardunculus var. scolymus TaxID=59895 RepID=UPI000D62D0CA|nr:uncharacterized protein LOC112502498 isoform X4 [Cynara cardunculus var. scolymus]
MATTKSVNASLWWEPFTDLLTELENLSTSSELPISLANKLKENHSWLLDSVSLFKPSNQKSREALDFQHVQIGSHHLTIQPKLKELAMKISSSLCLDEVQSYILVERSCEHDTYDLVVLEPLHLKVMVQYYIERQCILKCTRQILMLSLYVEDGSKADRTMREVVLKLISDGLEGRLLSVIESLLSATYPESMDVDVFTLWAEEMLIEDNLLLESKSMQRMISGSCNFGKLAISAEAVLSIYHAKVQLLLILIETLYLENLLQMLHDEIPFRQGNISFAMSDIQEVDAIISSFDAFETKEAGPLILTWAVFLCLISSLPEKQEHNVLMEIDHVGYVRQAFGAASLNYFDEILHSNFLKDLEGPIAGFCSVLRTFVSAFIASYEISLQLEDNNLKLILSILGEIYRGEESLCVQFWDRDSFIDGPIRCLLYNLEGEFPFRTVELISLLSALSEGAWPAECVYRFLDKSVGLSTLVELRGNLGIDKNPSFVDTQLPLCVPGLEGLQIPKNTRGRVLKVIDDNTALVRWEYTQSGVLVLLLRVAQEMYPDCSEEVLVTLDLLSRLVTFNKAVCYSLMSIGDTFHGKEITGLNMAEIICTLIKNLSSNRSGALLMSMGVNILAMMLKCSPSHVTPTVLKTNIFDVALRMNPFNIGSDGLSSGSWLLSGRLAKLLLIDCEHNDSSCPLAVSVLEFTIQLLEKGIENDFLLALVIFSIQYVLVNHEYWKYKVRHFRWKVTLKVLEFVKTCILSTSHSPKLGEIVRDLLLCDSSVHNALFRIVCITTPTLEKLYVSRLYEPTEIEGLQLAICSVLDIFSILTDFSKDTLPGYPVFLQAVLSSATKPIPVVTAIISLISFFRNPFVIFSYYLLFNEFECFACPVFLETTSRSLRLRDKGKKIQVGAVTALSMLLLTADDLQPYMSGNACLGLDDKQQIADFRNSIIMIISEQSPSNEDLIVSMFKMLASAAYYQPAFFVAITDSKDSTTEVSFGSLVTKGENLLDALGVYIKKFPELIKSHPKILLNILDFLMALWQGASQFINILEHLKKSENFWGQLSTCISLVSSMEDNSSGILSTDSLISSYRYQCQADILQIMSLEMFLQKKVLHSEFVRKGSELSKDILVKGSNSEKTEDDSHSGPREILSTWFKSSFLSKLIKVYASCEYDNDKYLKGQVSAALFFVQVIGKLRNGQTGSLSVSLVEKLSVLEKKLHDLPAFLELVTQYRQQGYSEGKELKNLILSDLYYHMQGEYEGREIEHKLFKELFQFLLESKLLESYQNKDAENLSIHAKGVFLFDCTRLEKDLGIDLWDILEWRSLKTVAETMLADMKDVNSMLLLSNCKLLALKALATMLPVYDEDVMWKATIGGELPEQLISSCFKHICQSLHKATESLVPSSDACKDVLDFLAAQAELLLHFIRFVQGRLSLPSCVLVIKTIESSLKELKDLKPSSVDVKPTLKLLLTVLLMSVQPTCINSPAVGSINKESEVSDVYLRLLPILCNFIEPVEYSTLSVATIDLLLKGFSSPTTWFPVIQKHLQVQNIVKRLHDKKYLPAVPVILKFLLTFARVRGGAEMLVNIGFFSSLRVLFEGSLDGGTLSLANGNESEKAEKEKPQHIWGLGLAVVSMIIYSLRDSSSNSDMVDYVISCFILEKLDLVSYCLNTPNFPPDIDRKKRARAQRKQTSLTALKETQHALMLICMLAKHPNLWIKNMKEMDSQLRERSIHLLAFISRGPHLGEHSRVAPLLCHPIVKEEFEWYKKPSFINSKSGWFSLSPVGCGLDPSFSALSSSSALVVKDPSAENIDTSPQTCFSDMAAIDVYKIAFYLLHFLCLQADAAAKRAEEVGFVDVAHFPDLPMPDILHGLQDQGIAVVSELCEANKLKQLTPEIEGVCILLLQITEKCLYLEFCVSQVCGIKPVMGRIEDFSKEVKLLFRATKEHVFLEESVKSLRQITSYVYPGLLQD